MTLTTPRRRTRGFTVIELVVVIAIVAVVAALAAVNLSRQRPRAHLASTTGDLLSLVHGARQTALATGHDVVVMVFPRHATPDGTGRVVIYEDGNYDFFTASAPGGMDFERFDPAARGAGTRSRVLEVYDLPREVALGTSPGGVAALPAPLEGIDVAVGCSFCGDLTDGRGAIRFDPRGRAYFYRANGPPSAVAGGALNLTFSTTSELRQQGQRTLVITPVTGSVRLIANG